MYSHQENKFIMSESHLKKSLLLENIEENNAT